MTQTQTPGPMATPEAWELLAPGYAAEMPLLMRGFSLRAIELLEPFSSARVVDVAAGPGTLSLEIAPRVAHVDALDFSAQMLDALRTQMSASGVSNVTTHVGDGQALPFGDQQYDLGASMFGLMFFPDRARGYAELFRVLRPGGRAIVSSWQPIEESPLISLMFGAVRAIEAAGATYERVSVPGSLEVPPAMAIALDGAERVRKPFDGAVGLGCVIRGETGHYDHVAGQAAGGIMHAGLSTGVPVIFGILTTETVEQALNRSGLKAGNNGYHAAVAAVEMATLAKKIS